jgi:hypothetical protein
VRFSFQFQAAQQGCAASDGLLCRNLLKRGVGVWAAAVTLFSRILPAAYQAFSIRDFYAYHDPLMEPSFKVSVPAYLFRLDFARELPTGRSGQRK